MPSLKDLRNRIASTKATQKITKAMQMVAASKLRRAQVAAEAARPYAERMDKVLGNIAAAMVGVESAPPLLRGTGQGLRAPARGYYKGGGAPGAPGAGGASPSHGPARAGIPDVSCWGGTDLLCPA